MKKAFLMVIALVMAIMLPVVSFADGFIMDPQTVNVRFEINKDALTKLIPPSQDGNNEKQEKTINAIADLVNNLSINLVSDGIGAEMTINVNDKQAAAFAMVESSQDAYGILSNMYNNCELLIYKEKINAMPKVELNEEELLKPIRELYDNMLEKVGEPEATSENFYNYLFKEKARIDITMKELSIKSAEVLDEILKNNQIKELLNSFQQMGGTVEISDFEQTIKELQEKDDSEFPDLDAYVYTNESNDKLIKINMKQDDQVVDANIGDFANEFILEIGSADQLDLFVKATEEEVVANLKAQKDAANSFEANISANKKDNGSDVVAEITFNGEQFLKIMVNSKEGGKLAGLFDNDDVTKLGIDPDKLSDQSSEEYQSLMRDLQLGLARFLTVVVQEVPEFAEILQNAQ